jgi:hypothetical protein
MGYDPYFQNYLRQIAGGEEPSYEPQVYRVGEIEARIAEAEAWAYQQAAEQAQAQAAQQHAENEQYLELQRLTDVAQQAQSLETQLGRALTGDEMRSIAGRLSEYVDAGREPDINAAFEHLQAEGMPTIDLDKRQDRLDYVTARFNDAERLDKTGDVMDLLEPDREPSREAYDLDTHEDRVAWMTDQANGIDTTGRTYESTGSTDAGQEAA